MARRGLANPRLPVCVIHACFPSGSCPAGGRAGCHLGSAAWPGSARVLFLVGWQSAVAWPDDPVSVGVDGDLHLVAQPESDEDAVMRLLVVALLR